MYKVLLTTALAAILLTSCTTTKEVYKAVPKAVPVYPELEDVTSPQSMTTMDEVTFDIPRDLSKPPVLREGCEGDPTKLAADDPCVVYPPILNTNIFMGLDEKNFENLLRNLDKSSEITGVYAEILEAINRQRRDWRAKNREAIEEIIND